MTLIIGTALGLILFILSQVGYWPIHFTINAGIVLLLSTLVFIFFSGKAPAPDAAVIDKFTFSRRLVQLDNEEMAWYQDYRFWSALLLAAIVGIFILLF